MELQSLPQSASAYADAQRVEILAALHAIERQWDRMGPDFDASYDLIEPNVLRISFTAQQRIAEGALQYVPDVMDETALAVPRTLEYGTSSKAFVGTAGDGLSVASLLYGGVIKAKTAVGDGAGITNALASSKEWMMTAAGTMFSDTGRSAEKVAGGAHRVKLWTRMLEPPSCGRCVILAGKTSRHAEAFNRHPKCDCRNIPSSEATADDTRVDPHGYFNSLSEKDQETLMGSKANAQAMRDGADLNQIINAYRKGGDVRAAQVNGRLIKHTTEGTTRRGYAYSSMSQAEYVKAQGMIRKEDSRARRLRAPRMMPETIYGIAKDEADAKRLLKLYGWIL